MQNQQLHNQLNTKNKPRTDQWQQTTTKAPPKHNQGTTNAAQTDDEPPAAAKIRRTTTVARLASNEECNFGLLALRQHRRSSTALYCSELGTADPDLAGPCPWGSPSTPPNCFLISDRPNAAKFYKVQMTLVHVTSFA